MAKKTQKKVARRKPASKRTIHKKATKRGAVAFGTAVQTKGVKLTARASRISEYQPLFDAMSKLRLGQTIPIEVPKGIDARAMHNRLSSAIQRYGPEAPKGSRFSKRSMDDGRIAISRVRT